MGRYSKLDITSRLQRLLAGDSRDRLPDRPTRSVRRLRRLTESEVGQIVERYESGDLIAVLASEFGVHRTTISAQLRLEACGNLPPGLPRMSRLRSSGSTNWAASLARLAERFTVSQSTVSRLLRAAGVTSRPVGTNQWSVRS